MASTGTVTNSSTANTSKWFNIDLQQAGGGQNYFYDLKKVDRDFLSPDFNIWDYYVFRQLNAVGQYTTQVSLNSGSLQGVGQGPGTSSPSTTPGHFQFKVKNQSSAKEVEDEVRKYADQIGMNIEEGGEFQVGEVVFTAYKDNFVTPYTDQEIRDIFNDQSISNPSYADVYFQIKTGDELKIDLVLEACLKSSNLRCQEDDEGTHDPPKNLADTLILTNLDPNDLPIDYSQDPPWPSSPTFQDYKDVFKGGLGLQYKTCKKVVDRDTVDGEYPEIPNFFGCYEVTDVFEAGEAPACVSRGCHDEDFDLVNFRDASTPVEGGPCDDEVNCSAKGRALMNATAVNYATAMGFDPTTLTEIGCAVDTETVSGESAVGYYKWIRYQANGVRAGGSFNGIASVTNHTVDSDNILCLNTDYQHSRIEVKTYMSEVRNVVFQAMEEWKQTFTVMVADDDQFNAMEQEMNHKGYTINPDKLELAKATLRKVLSASKSKGVGIKGDNFEANLDMHMLTTTGANQESVTQSYSAKVKYNDFLRYVTGEVGGTGVSNDVIKNDVIEVSCSFTKGASVVNFNDQGIPDTEPDWLQDSTLFEMVDIGLKHSIYFVNGWEVDYQANFGGSTTETINGVTETFQEYASFGVRKSFWKDKFVFSGQFDSNGQGTLGVYNSPGQWTYNAGPASLSLNTGATYSIGSGEFTPTLGFNIAFFDSLNISYNALTGSSKALFQKSLDYSSGNLESDGYRFQMNLNATADLLQQTGSIGAQITFEAALLDCKKLHSKVYFKADMNGRFGINMPGSGLLANQGISFKAGISASLIYQADWLKFLGVPLRIGFGPSIGASLNIYTDATGLGGQTGGGSAFAMTMGIWHFNYEILNTLDLELEVQHESVMGKVPILGALLKHLPIIGNLGPKEPTPDYLKRVVPVRTSNLMIGCRKEYENWIDSELTKAEANEKRRVIQNNLCGYNTISDGCEQARIMSTYVYLKKKEILELNPFCNYIRGCFSNAKLNKLTQVYRNVPTGNWDNKNDGPNPWDRDKSVSEMHVLEDECFESFIDADDPAALEAEANSRTGLINQLFATGQSAQGGFGGVFMTAFKTFSSLIGVIANVVTAGVYGRKQNCQSPDGSINCPDFGNFTIDAKANRKHLESLYSYKRCTTIQSLSQCDSFYIAWRALWEAYLESKEIYDDLQVLEPQIKGACPIPAAAQKQFLDRHVVIDTLDKLRINELKFQQSMLRTLCPAGNDLNDLEWYDDFYEFSDGQGTGSACDGAEPDTPCGCGAAMIDRMNQQGIDSTGAFYNGKFNPCVRADWAGQVIARDTVFAKTLHGNCVLQITNPLCSDDWDCTAKNYGSGSFESLCDIQNILKNAYNSYSNGAYGAAYGYIAEYNTKRNNFNPSAPDSVKDMQVPLYKAILNQLDWFESLVSRGCRHSMAFNSYAVMKSIEDDYWDTNGWGGLSPQQLADNLKARCVTDLGSSFSWSTDFPLVGFFYLGDYPSLQTEDNFKVSYVDDPDDVPGLKKINDFKDDLAPNQQEIDSGFFVL